MKKRFASIVLLMLLALPVLSQNLVSSFLGEMDDGSRKSATQINISGRMLRFAADKDSSGDEDLKKLMNSIDKISMVANLSVTDKQKDRLKKMLQPYEELMSVVEDGQSIVMYTKEKNGRVEEFVLSILSGNELVLMSVAGKIDLEQISRLSESVNIQGMEHLGRINNKKK